MGPVFRAVALIFVLAGLGSCGNSQLLVATASYATISQATMGDIAAAPGIVLQLCRQRLEIEYLTDRLIPEEKVGALQDFVDKKFKSASGHVDITWKQRCAALHIPDDAFARGIGALNAYGAALGTLAGHDLASPDALNLFAAACAADSLKITGDALPYQGAIQGLGAGLTDLARLVEGAWRDHKLKKIIVTADPALQKVIGGLQEFIKTVRKRELNDARHALHDLVDALDLSRAPNDITLSHLTGRIDIDITDKLDALDGQLAAIDALLQQLADAHARLRDGWEHGDKLGVETARAVSQLARDAYQSLKQFQNPTKSGP